jgi:hypothetical protein
MGLAVDRLQITPLEIIRSLLKVPEENAKDAKPSTARDP